MKKSIKITALLSVLAVSILLTTTKVQAVGVSTDTDAGFQAGGSLKPETPVDGEKEPDTPPKEIEGGGSNEGGGTTTIGGVTLTHVPTISFGTGNGISLSEANYQAVTEKISVPNEEANGGVTEYYSPHFVQVGDVSGKSSPWKVTVLQTVPYTQGTGTNASVLNNTRIRIYENSIVSPNQDKAAKVSGINKGSLAYAQIPLKGSDGGEGITVISVNAGENVSGSIISSAFSDNYQLADYYDSETGATNTGKTESRYNGVRLNIPKGEDVQEGTYQGKLEWTFTVAQ